MEIQRFSVRIQGAQICQHLPNYTGSFFIHNSLMYSKLHCDQLYLTHTLPYSMVLGNTW